MTQRQARPTNTQPGGTHLAAGPTDVQPNIRRAKLRRATPRAARVYSPIQRCQWPAAAGAVTVSRGSCSAREGWGRRRQREAALTGRGRRRQREAAGIVYFRCDPLTSQSSIRADESTLETARKSLTDFRPPARHVTQILSGHGRPRAVQAEMHPGRRCPLTLGLGVLDLLYLHVRAVGSSLRRVS